ncbi:MAG: hypothetical protein CL431_08150 [Acidimicrobiaceae bacterium]|nr:hypothetical protein [Acidimicrobiaceae bacterium]
MSEVSENLIQETSIVSNEKAQNTFSTAMVISGIRCAFTYVIFPVFAPALGIASGVGSGIGLVASVIGIAANLFSIKRFHSSNHQWKWRITALNVSVIILLSVLLVLDIASLT